MDQAPAALSSILGSALNEIREELNELKHSNTTLLNKIDSLEAARAQLQSELDGRIQENHAQLDAQITETNEIRVALAAVQNENATLRVLLTALGQDERDTQAPKNEEPVQIIQRTIAVTDDDDGASQASFLTAPNVQLSPFTREMSVESSMTFCTAEQSAQRQKRRALGLYDKAVHFPPDNQKPDDTARQSSPPKKRKIMCSTASAIPEQDVYSHVFPVPTLPHRPLKVQERKFAVSQSSFVQSSSPDQLHAGWTPVNKVPNCPARQSLASRKDSIQVEETRDADGDVDMEDTIAVAPRHMRRSFQALKDLDVPEPPPSPTMSEAVRIVDDVLQDFDVSPPPEATREEQPFKPSATLNRTSQSSLQSQRMGSSCTSSQDNEVVNEDADVVDPDSNLLYEPENRGENDQTGVRGERVYQSISINGATYTVDRSRACANNAQPWKSWVVNKNGDWYQWKHYQSLDWADAAAVEKMNYWRSQTLQRAGFPKMRLARQGEYTAEERDWLFEHVKAAKGDKPTMTIKELADLFNDTFPANRDESSISGVITRLRSEYKTNNGEQKPKCGVVRRTQTQAQATSVGEILGELNPTAAKMNSSQPKVVTRSDLLSQFKARTGDMQKGNGSSSPEQME